MSYRKPPAFKAHPIKFSKALSYQMFRGICYQVIDGDTADFMIDLGWYQYSYSVLRFNRLDTPELRGSSPEEKARAEKARDRVKELILDKPVLIKTERQATTFGRFVAEVYFFPEDDLQTSAPRITVENEDGESLGMVSLIDLMIAEGHEKKRD
jgi:endonuclease YncB( thermonuclease family)